MSVTIYYCYSTKSTSISFAERIASKEKNTGRRSIPLNITMFKRKSSSSGGLPTTIPLSVPQGDGGGSSFGQSMGFGNRGPDGSGQAIKMDAPIVKNWKQASGFTKFSYYILGACLFMAFIGYRYLRYWNGKHSSSLQHELHLCRLCRCTTGSHSKCLTALCCTFSLFCDL